MMPIRRSPASAVRRQPPIFPTSPLAATPRRFLTSAALIPAFWPAPPIYREFNYQSNGDYRKSDFDSFQLGVERPVGRPLDGPCEFSIIINTNSRTRSPAWPSGTCCRPAAYRATTQSLFDYLTTYLANPSGTLEDTTKTSTVTLTRRKRLQQSYAKSNAVQAEAAGKYEFDQVKFRPLVGAFRIYTNGGGFTRTAAAAQFFPAWNYFNRSTWDRSGEFR